MKKLLLSKGAKKALVISCALIAVIAMGISFVHLSLSAKQIEITFETFGGETIEALTYSAHDYTPSLPKARKDGYYFEGWFLDKEYTQPIKKLDIIKTSTTLYAKYALREYTITYHNADIGDNPETYNIMSGDIVLSNAVRGAQTFLGWYANDSFAGTPIKEIKKGQVGNLDLYARWLFNFSFLNLGNNFNSSSPALESSDNINQYIQMHGDGYVQFCGVPYSLAMTYEIWVKSETAGNYFIFDHRQGQNGLALYLWADGSIMAVNGYGAITESGGNQFKFNNQWHHLAVAANANSISLFYDGKPLLEDLENGITVANIPDSNLCLGNNIAHSADGFVGCLDDFRVWNIKRQDEDIFHYRFADYKEQTANLAAYCSFNQHEKYIYDMEFESENIALSKESSPEGASASLNFNGSNNYVTTENMQTLREATWEVWVKSGSTKDQIVLDHRKDNKGITPICLAENGAIIFSYNCIEEKILSTEAGVFQFDNKWHHIAVSTLATKVKIYYDGGLAATSDWGIMQKVAELDERQLYIGCKFSKDALFFEGQIDEVRIFNKAKSAEEIQAEMGLRLTGIEDNLIMYLDFDNNLLDKTSNHLHCNYQGLLRIAPILIKNLLIRLS